MPIPLQAQTSDTLTLEEATARRYHDPTFKVDAVKIYPGECYVTKRDDEMLVTVLGSCIAACIRDPVAGVGGMNHFMLPQSPDITHKLGSASLRYGDFAMTKLINGILSRGGDKARLEVKIFGGAHLWEGDSIAVGDDNVAFIEQYVRHERLRVTSQHVRGRSPRRIHYFPSTGRLMMRLLTRRGDANAIRARDQQVAMQLNPQIVEGDVELFS